MNHVDIKLFEESKNLLYWFLEVSFPGGLDEETDMSLIAYMEENYEFDDNEINDLTQMYEGVFDENDGYVDDPKILSVPLGNDQLLSVAFHPGDIEYYINDKMIGCTGPDYVIHQIDYPEFVKMTEGLKSIEKMFLLPMVYVKNEHIIELKRTIKCILRDIQIEDVDDRICEFIISNCTQ